MRREKDPYTTSHMTIEQLIEATNEYLGETRDSIVRRGEFRPRCLIHLRNEWKEDFLRNSEKKALGTSMVFALTRIVVHALDCDGVIWIHSADSFITTDAGLAVGTALAKLVEEHGPEAALERGWVSYLPIIAAVGQTPEHMVIITQEIKPGSHRFRFGKPEQSVGAIDDFPGQPKMFGNITEQEQEIADKMRAGLGLKAR